MNTDRIEKITNRIEFLTYKVDYLDYLISNGYSEIGIRTYNGSLENEFEEKKNELERLTAELSFRVALNDFNRLVILAKVKREREEDRISEEFRLANIRRNNEYRLSSSKKYREKFE